MKGTLKKRFVSFCPNFALSSLSLLAASTAVSSQVPSPLQPRPPAHWLVCDTGILFLMSWRCSQKHHVTVYAADPHTSPDIAFYVTPSSYILASSTLLIRRLRLSSRNCLVVECPVQTSPSLVNQGLPSIAPAVKVDMSLKLFSRWCC